MNIEDLHEDFREAVKQISENRNKLTESKRNKLTAQLIEREKFQVYNYNCELNGELKRVKRAALRVHNFWLNFRLSNLHLFNEKDLKEGDEGLNELFEELKNDL